MMIAAAKKMALFTWLEASAMTASFAPISCFGVRGLKLVASARLRKMFSTMMTVASTIRPKSMAPTDRRFADSPRSVMIRMAKNRAKGMVAATITALRRLPRNTHCTRKISTMPKIMLCSTVWVVTWIRSDRS